MLYLPPVSTAPDAFDAVSLRSVPLHETTSAETLLRKAGLDWEVRAVPMYLPDTSGNLRQSERDRAVVRVTDGRHLGTVGMRYHPVQQIDVFSLFDSFAQAGLLRFARAGQFHGGSVVWIQAEITDKAPMRIGPDTVKRYALAVLSHDGSMSVRFAVTPTRVACWNTLIAAIMNADTATVIRHTAAAAIRLADASRALERAGRAFAEFEHGANRLLAAPMSDREMVEFAAYVLPGSKGQDTAVATRTENARREVIHLFRHGKGHEEITGTRWAAYNAIAEYTDYQRSTRGEGNRMASAFVGSGAALKRAAWSSLLA
jgi:phage/plasmid-like protein (TIGR03299 family)